MEGLHSTLWNEQVPVKSAMGGLHSNLWNETITAESTMRTLCIL